MTASLASSLKSVQLDDLRALAGCSGFCLTVLAPPVIPGEATTRYSAAALLRGYAREAESRLKELGAAREAIAAMIEPLAKLASDPALGEGFHWSRVMLRSPEISEEFVLRCPVDGSMTVAWHFQLLPLVAEAGLPRELYVLKLTKKRAALARAGTRLEKVVLPKTVETLDDFLELAKPDHDLENRSTAGGGAGRRVRFGTGDERENAQAYLADFYKYIDSGLSSLLHGRDARVVLMGVEEDTALYRSVCRYPEVLGEPIQRSPDDGSTDEQVLERAFALLHDSTLRRHASAVAAARERLAPSRFSTDPDEILKAAAEGRVAQLYTPENARDEKLNRALIETLTHGGEVFALSPGAEAAAAFRY